MSNLSALPWPYFEYLRNFNGNVFAASHFFPVISCVYSMKITCSTVHLETWIINEHKVHGDYIDNTFIINFSADFL